MSFRSLGWVYSALHGVCPPELHSALPLAPRLGQFSHLSWSSCPQDGRAGLESEVLCNFIISCEKVLSEMSCSAYVGPHASFCFFWLFPPGLSQEIHALAYDFSLVFVLNMGPIILWLVLQLILTSASSWNIPLALFSFVSVFTLFPFTVPFKLFPLPMLWPVKFLTIFLDQVQVPASSALEVSSASFGSHDWQRLSDMSQYAGYFRCSCVQVSLTFLCNLLEYRCHIYTL